MKTKTSAGVKLLLSLGALLVALAVIELGLNAAAFLMKPRIPVTRAGDASGIACYGDSYTYGLGAEPSASYPAQLEALLRTKGLDVTVTNYGYPGSNSRKAAEAFLATRKAPRVAVVMTGYNNFWNVEGLEDELARSPLAKTRIARMLRIVAANMGKRFFLRAETGPARCDPASPAPSEEEWGAFTAKTQTLIREGRQEEARRAVTEMLAAWPGSQLVEKYMATFEREAGNYDAALGYALRALADCACPAEEPHIRLELVYLYRITGRYAQALEEIKKTVADSAYIKSVYPELANICREAGLDHAVESEKLRRLILKLHGSRGQAVWDMIAYADSHASELGKTVERDLELMIGSAAARGVRVVLLTYPFDAPINRAILGFARSHRLPVVDTAKLFEGRPREEFFAADGHCNARGYGVIAGAVAALLEGNGWLNS